MMHVENLAFICFFVEKKSSFHFEKGLAKIIIYIYINYSLIWMFVCYCRTDVIVNIQESREEYYKIHDISTIITSGCLLGKFMYINYSLI